MTNSHNQRKFGVILSYISRIFGTLISLAYTPWMLRVLGQSEYGLYQATGSVISWLGLLSLGFGGAYIRFFSQYKAKDDQVGIARLNGLFLMFYAAIALIALISGWQFSHHVELFFGEKLTAGEVRTAGILMKLMTVSMAVNFVDVVFVSFVTVHERFIYQSILGIINTALNPLLGIPLLLMGYASVALSCVSLIVACVSLASNILVSKRLGISFGGFHFDGQLFKALAIFSSLLCLSSIAGAVNGFVDSILLTRMVGPEAVAVYDIGNRFNLYLMGFSVTIFGVFIPKVNLMVAERTSMGELTNLMIRVGRIQFYVISFFFLAYLLLGRYFISIYAGENYSGSYIVGALVISGCFIPYFQNLGIEIQKAMNKHVMRSIIFLLVALLNVIISIPMIHLWGTFGAAFGTFLALILGNTIFMNIYYKYKIGLDISLFWRSFTRPCLCFLLLAGVGYFIQWQFPVQNIMQFCLGGMLYVIAYLLVFWILVFNQEEKSFFMNFLHLRKKA